MEKIIQALAEANIPTMLTVSGIALLFLSLAGRFGTYIEIKSERQKLATVVGSAMLLAGVVLHVYPALGVNGAKKEPVIPDDRPDIIGHRNGEENMRWILAGSFAAKNSADAIRDALIAAKIDAVVVRSNLYEFLCPGYFTVMVPSPNLSTTQSILVRVREIVPKAYPRTPATFDPSTCP